MFKILSVDGGGFRGVYAAHILKRIEEEYQVDWTRDFDMIIGTSTGSIIAAGLVFGLRASEIARMYEGFGKSVFKKKWFCRSKWFGWIPSLFASPYNAGNLKKELDKIFGNKRLGDYSFPLIIPATDIGNGSVYVFKTQYDSDFVRDKDIKVSDAVLSSCSAPAYFDPHQTDKYLLADGGLWANSPGLVATIDAKYRLHKSLDELRILSVGTGESRSFYSMGKSWCGWGFLTRWNREQLIATILNLQAQSANNMLELLLNRDQILRINETDMNMPMDDPKLLEQLISRAEKRFTEQAQKIRTFLNKKGEL
ncbi:MAG: patatin-like phospholipase family protein [Planctomycetaceae bacterium]|jgi:patatin-like phospholipase/acyl hydrolase|nr:patatin-like phospholipase family protein [Planctomycetaceae bacterium]